MDGVKIPFSDTVKYIGVTLDWRTQRCTIAWVKTHIGKEGKEAADGAARKGAENKTNTLPIIKNSHTGGYLEGNNKQKCGKENTKPVKLTPDQANRHNYRIQLTKPYSI